MKLLSRVRLFATPWTVANQAPPSTGFSRQEYWSGLPFPSPGDLPDPGIEPGSPGNCKYQTSRGSNSEQNRNTPLQASLVPKLAGVTEMYPSYHRQMGQEIQASTRQTLYRLSHQGSPPGGKGKDKLRDWG